MHDDTHACRSICIYVYTWTSRRGKRVCFLLWTYFILFSFTVKHPRYFIREDWQQQTDRHRSTSPSKLFSSSTDLQGQPIFSQTSFHNSGSFPYRSFTTFPMCPTTATALAAGVRIPGLFRSPAGGCAEASGKPQRGPRNEKSGVPGPLVCPLATWRWKNHRKHREISWNFTLNLHS